MKKQKNRRKRNAGFSLVELIIVIAILAILIGVISPVLIKQIDKARASKCLTEMDNLNRAYEIELYSFYGDDYYTLLDQVFTEAGVTKAEGTRGQYIDSCPSGGTYTVELDPDSGAIMMFTCSKHTNNVVEPTESNYITYLAMGFMNYFKTTDKRVTRYDSEALKIEGTNVSGAKEQLEKALSDVGLNMTDTCMWKVLYKDNQIKVYWIDNGNKIDSKQDNLTGSWMPFDIETGKKTGQQENARIYIDQFESEYGKYYTITNEGDW